MSIKITCLWSFNTPNKIIQAIDGLTMVQELQKALGILLQTKVEDWDLLVELGKKASQISNSGPATGTPTYGCHVEVTGIPESETRSNDLNVICLGLRQIYHSAISAVLPVGEETRLNIIVAADVGAYASRTKTTVDGTWRMPKTTDLGPHHFRRGHEGRRVPPEAYSNGM